VAVAAAAAEPAAAKEEEKEEEKEEGGAYPHGGEFGRDDMQGGACCRNFVAGHSGQFLDSDVPGCCLAYCRKLEEVTPALAAAVGVRGTRASRDAYDVIERARHARYAAGHGDPPPRRSMIIHKRLRVDGHGEPHAAVAVAVAAAAAAPVAASAGEEERQALAEDKQYARPAEKEEVVPAEEKEDDAAVASAAAEMEHDDVDYEYHVVDYDVPGEVCVMTCRLNTTGGRDGCGRVLADAEHVHRDADGNLVCHLSDFDGGYGPYCSVQVCPHLPRGKSGAVRVSCRCGATVGVMHQKKGQYPKMVCVKAPTKVSFVEAAVDGGGILTRAQLKARFFHAGDTHREGGGSGGGGGGGVGRREAAVEHVRTGACPAPFSCSIP
jgi:nucleoid-associated protein YgaU